MQTYDGNVERQVLSMCEFCRQWNDENTICRAEIKIHKCANETNLTEAQILKNVGDNKPGIVIIARTAAVGYFNIEFCPMCGRKLVE